MDQKLLIANWKMNGTENIIAELTEQYIQLGENDQVETVLCPSSLYLPLVNNIVKQGRISMGAQDCSIYMKGSFTGETGALMLKEVGCKYVIIGHSERRKYFNETSETISLKIKAAQEANLIPILCVGEELSSRKESKHIELIRDQIEKSQICSLEGVIAYEPMWSIGTGLVLDLKEIEEVITMIKNFIRLPVIYGGSVNGENSQSLAGIKNLDGFLVGAASLKPEEFNKIHYHLAG